MTKLSSRLPKGNADGLQRVAGALVAQPHRPRFAILAFDCMRVTTDTDTGEHEPTARILRIEPLDLSDYVDAHNLMRRGYDRRIGQDTLPFDDRADDSLDTLFKAARDTSGRVHLKFDDDGTITAVTIDGTELQIATTDEALDDLDTDERDPLLSVAMDAVIQAQDADVNVVIDAILAAEDTDPDPDGSDDRAGIVARAERILTQLETAGIVTSPYPDGTRAVLFTRDGLRLDTAEHPPEDDDSTDDPDDDTDKD